MTRRQPPSFDGDSVWKWTLRCAGLSIVFWQTVFDHYDRPELLVLAAAMMGVHLVLKREGGSNGGSKNGKKPPTEE